MDNTVGLTADNWTPSREARGSGDQVHRESAARSLLRNHFDRVCLSGRCSEHSVPTCISTIQDRSGETSEGTAVVKRRPPPGSGEFHSSERSSLRSLPAWLLSMRCSGQLNAIRWIAGASPRNHYRLVQGPRLGKVRL